MHLKGVEINLNYLKFSFTRKYLETFCCRNLSRVLVNIFLTTTPFLMVVPKESGFAAAKANKFSPPMVECTELQLI
jgi:hypothetical protein